MAAILGLVAGDALKPPSDQWTARAALGAIDAYRATVSPMLARTGVVRCRFTPTCSEYGREAIERYGFPRGFALATGRVLRCNPWSDGGLDPVP
jgi:putative membrane protein insertion efficiency factor